MLFPLRALDVMYIEMQVVIDVEHPTGALVGVINGEEGLNIDDMVQNAKQLINLRDWGYIYVAKNSKLRTYNADGTLKPVVEWEIPQYVYFNEFHLRKGTPHVQIARLVMNTLTSACSRSHWCREKCSLPMRYQSIDGRSTILPMKYPCAPMLQDAKDRPTPQSNKAKSQTWTERIAAFATNKVEM